MKSFSFFKQIFAAIVLGIAVGHFIGPNASALGEIGKIIIDLIKAAAAPLLFVTILHGCVAHSVRGKDAVRMIAVSILNVSVALFVAITLSRLFQPGLHFAKFIPPAVAQAPTDLKPMQFGASLLSFIPKSLVEPFATNNILGLVFLALVVGFAMRATSEDIERTTNAIESVQKTLAKLISWVVALVPLALFGVIAKSYGEYGFEPVKGLVSFVGICLLGFFIQVVLVYHSWIKLYGRISITQFWSIARSVVFQAIGSNSSLATLPATLTALDELKVSRRASTLGACVGTNLNNDGIVLYEAAAFFFVAQASHIDLSIGQQVLGALTCVVAAMGIAGVPEAGFISLAVVLATLKLPTETLPLLLSVDWILARCRSATNALADMTLSIALDDRRMKS